MNSVNQRPTMSLSQLLRGLVQLPAALEHEIHGLCLDSRKVQAGDLFVALAGSVSDGKHYIEQAVAAGAVAVLYEAEPNQDSAVGVGQNGIAHIALVALRNKLGYIAERFYGMPSQHLWMIGVTGTNGKTTCSQLLAQCLDGVTHRCGVIGTLGNGFPGALDAGTHTTPDAVSVHALLADLHARGASSVCMEVSSHALVQRRVAGVAFDLALFTNLSRDHLDYHGDMNAYGAAKAALFDFPELSIAIINHDDSFGQALLRRLQSAVDAGRDLLLLSYGLEQGDVCAKAIVQQRDGMLIDAVTPAGEVQLRSRLIGRFNASNLLAVLACLLQSGMDLAQAAARLTQCQAVPGRLEGFAGSSIQPVVVVDYAHTPDALEQALLALREHAQGQLWCVFGCGGDRDRGKRALMGAVAERLADRIVVTDDNPRHEDPQRIIDDILSGMRLRPLVQRDRRAAIHFAIHEAGQGDTVLVAGKGHEDYQQIGDERLPFSDRALVRELLEQAA